MIFLATVTLIRGRLHFAVCTCSLFLRIPDQAWKCRADGLDFSYKLVHVLFAFLSCLKVLKLYAWEESFINKIAGIRTKEVKYLKKAAFLNASFDFSFACAPFLVSSYISDSLVMFNRKCEWKKQTCRQTTNHNQLNTKTVNDL